MFLRLTRSLRKKTTSRILIRFFRRLKIPKRSFSTWLSLLNSRDVASSKSIYNSRKITPKKQLIVLTNRPLLAFKNARNSWIWSSGPSRIKVIRILTSPVIKSKTFLSIYSVHLSKTLRIHPALILSRIRRMMWKVINSSRAPYVYRFLRQKSFFFSKFDINLMMITSQRTTRIRWSSWHLVLEP